MFLALHVEQAGLVTHVRLLQVPYLFCTRHCSRRCTRLRVLMKR